MPYVPKDATPATAGVNRDAAGLYELADRQDFPDAARGLIAPWPGPVVSSADGHVIFDPGWLTVSGPKAALIGAILQPAAARQLAQAGKIQLDGDQSALAAYAGLLDEFDLNFNIVTP
jgi:alkyl sulfatase BDS1-like metallo-beta-lactamase superfamily hydrolase